jgi:hypothetical protein
LIKPERLADDGDYRAGQEPERSLATGDHEERGPGERRAYTMLGDTVADAYAALMPKYGRVKILAKLTRDERGGENAADAPLELVNFIRAMEATPDWVDMKLVEEGARSREDRRIIRPS